MAKPRPVTVVMIAFATGSVTIQCAKGRAEVIALMNVPDEEWKQEHGQTERLVPVRVQIPSISETDVKEDPRSQVIQYTLKNEMIEFRRKDVVFWSVAEAVDPPIIQELAPGARQTTVLR